MTAGETDCVVHSKSENGRIGKIILQEIPTKRVAYRSAVPVVLRISKRNDEYANIHADLSEVLGFSWDGLMEACRRDIADTGLFIDDLLPVWKWWSNMTGSRYDMMEKFMCKTAFMCRSHIVSEHVKTAAYAAARKNIKLQLECGADHKSDTRIRKILHELCNPSLDSDGFPARVKKRHADLCHFYEENVRYRYPKAVASCFSEMADGGIAAFTEAKMTAGATIVNGWQ